VDGSPARKAEIELAGVVGPTVLTTVEVRSARLARGGSPIERCLRTGGDPLGPIVVRVGASGESVTFSDRSRLGLQACDSGAGLQEDDRPWCGSAFGQLHDGRLRDPRLDLGGCETADGQPVGFAWVEPNPGAAYVAVRQPGYAEVYELAGRLPIRVTTSAVDLETSSALFDVSEHTADGGLLRRYELETRVAG
jgi:hypothetical protein